MSSPAAPPIAPPISPIAPRAIDPETYIDSRLEETRRHVRAVDLTVAALKLCIGVLAYLMAFAVADHWLVAGGLGGGTRLAVWAVMVLVAGWYAVRVLLPLLVHRINPVFAAKTIEQTRPSFKNGLINFLLLRREREQVAPDELSQRVYRGLEVRTANELTQVTVGNTVDRLHIIRLGYLLASLVAVICLYFLVSPKNPLVSFGRVILPWSRIGAPTRVDISGIAPGDATAYQGDNVEVSAEIRGLRSGEPATLVYSSVDGESVDQSVPMSAPERGFRYQGELPPGSLGLQQNLVYRIVAGDATSPTFRIDVQIPPAILIDRVEYEYPEYTGLAKRVALREGDLRGVEGTRVTIYSTANYPIAQAFIELEGDSRHSVPMTASGTAASGRLTLAMSPTDHSRAEYGWYQLRFTDSERRENRRPIRHRIEVIPDQRPEVRFIDPPPDELQLPATSSVELKVRAEDPDFGLRRVALRAEREGRGLLIPPLLNKPRPQKPHQGPCEAVYRFQPAQLGLKAGDTVTYWAEAADCKEKEEDKGAGANLAETEKRTIHIVAADGRQPPAKQRPEEGSKKKEGTGEKGEGRGEKGEGTGEKKDGTGEKGEGTGAKEEERWKKAEDGTQKKGQAEKGEMGEPAAKAAEQDQGDNRGADQKQAAKPDGQKGAPGEKGASGEKDQESRKPVSDNDPGEAFERILKQREEDQAKSQPEKEGDTQAKSKPQQGTQKSQGKKPPDEQKGEGNQTPENQQKGAGTPNSGDNRQPGSEQKSSEEQKAGGKKDAEMGRRGDAEKKDEQAAGGEKKDAAMGKGGDAEKKGEQAAGGEKKDAAIGKGGDAEKKGEQAAGGEKKDAAMGKGGDAEKKSEQAAGGEKKDAAMGKGGGAEKRDAEMGRRGDAEKTDAEKGGRGDAEKQDAEMGRRGDAEKQDAEGEKKGENQRPSDAQKTGQPPAASPQSGDEKKSGEPMAAPDKKKGEEGGDQQKGARGTDSQPRPESKGAGKPSSEKASLPPAQEANQPRAMNQDDAGAKKQSGDRDAQSPSISPKTSDSKSDTEGDRSGGGKAGGGQQAKQPGSGTPGSKTPSEQGGETSDEQGKGEIGTKAGQQAKSDKSTGQPGAKGEAKGSSGDKQPGASDAAKKPQSQDPSQKSADTAKAGQKGTEQSSGKEPGEKGGSTSGNPTAGGQAGDQTAGDAPSSQPAPPRPDDPNLEYARKQTTLALEYLADQLAKEKPEVLERLGWDRVYAENFLRQWEQMRKAANEPGPQQEAAKRELDMALNSLGLRPTKGQVRPGQTPRDKLQQLRDAGRIPPPPEWMEQYRAYTEGVGGGKD